MLTDLLARGPFRQSISLPRRRDGFHIMATSAGYEVAGRSAYDWDGRRRGNTPFSVLQHTVEGSGHLIYEKQSFLIRPGDTMLVTIPHAHRYWLDAGGTWGFFWIAMSGQEALRLHRTILKTVGPVFRLDPQTVDELSHLCIALAAPNLTAGRASSHAYEATMSVHDDLMTHHAVQGGATEHRALGRVIAHIRDHLDEPLDIDTLARVAGMSRAHFSRLFARLEGTPPSEYVLQQRMQRAASLAVSGSLSVKGIAIACGFHDPNYFSKVFRRAFAISPSEFRTNGMYSATA